MKVLDVIAGILVIIGALNWGLYGALEIDVVAKTLGVMTTAARVVYILIGIAGLYRLFFCKAIHCRWCKDH